MSPQMGEYTLEDDNAIMAAHVADLDAHTKNLLEEIRTGEYQIMPGGDNPTQTQNLAANQLYAYFFILARARILDRIAIEVTAGGGGGTRARLGVYAAGADMYPGALELDCGTVDANAVAVAPIVGLNHPLTKGLWWLAIITDGTPTIYAQRCNWSPLGVNAGAMQINNGYWQVAQAYGVLPDPFTAGGAIQAGRTNGVKVWFSA